MPLSPLGGHEAELNHVEKAFGSQRRPHFLVMQSGFGTKRAGAFGAALRPGSNRTKNIPQKSTGHGRPLGGVPHSTPSPGGSPYLPLLSEALGPPQQHLCWDRCPWALLGPEMWAAVVASVSQGTQPPLGGRRPLWGWSSWSSRAPSSEQPHSGPFSRGEGRE